MNDRPSSGQYPNHGYDGLSTTTFAGDSGYAPHESQGQGYNYAAYGSYDTGSYDTGAYDTGGYDTTAWTTPQSSYPQQPQAGYDTADGYDGYLSTVPAQAVSTDYQSTAFGYDTSAEQTGHWSVPGYAAETSTYDYSYGYEQPQEQQYSYETYSAYEETAPAAYTETSVFGVVTDEVNDEGDSAADAAPYSDADSDGDAAAAELRVHDLPTQAMPVTLAAPSVPRPSRRAGKSGSGGSGGSSGSGGNTRRRTPAKRSALLTVAVPSACVMGVAGVAAASVGGLTGPPKPSEETTTMAAPDPASIKPVAANSKLDTQLTALSADAGDFANRASRTQERIDLRLRQDEEKKKKAEEEAAKEAARPKFVLPVEQHGLSAGFGQAGVNWMSVHTGIDFPVSYGTSVMAATDGTVRSQWNSAYGNMVILTAPDGTETWYCHLSSAKIRSGKVKAGDVIAYSGNSGNSTGPHLHFEVRPGGGTPIDPQAWLRSHDLDPN
ncbi:M23 family metallopeptidase [Streptomyces sp. NPDC059443]|uniref:M23 family metallopeptidase n=1 Tax=unclassified Streptomyces TaxID=2593676 RepID=UPI00368FC55F